MANGDLLAAKRKAEGLLGIEGISGVGAKKKSNPGESIKVYVEKLTTEIHEKIPRRIDGFPVEIFETGGKFRFHQIDRKAKMRPAFGGVSIGHYSITAGTLGCRVFDAATGQRMILGNNHVLAAMAGVFNTAKVGDPILQPGAYDGGSLNDTFATLTRWIPYGLGDNLVDCAVAMPVNDGDLSDEILEIGVPYKAINVNPVTDMKVIKSGRSTGATDGKILDVDATIKVYLDDTAFLRFTDQIITTSMAEGGDSGSLTMDTNHYPIGLLFAGSGNLTAHNKILPVCQKLGINFGSPLPSAISSPPKLSIPLLAGIFALPIVMGIAMGKK